MPSAISVDLAIAGEVDQAPDEALLRSCVEDVIGDVDCGETSTIELAVRIVGEAEGRALNHKFRDIDKATNVLSFPADLTALPPEGPRMLGDIVLCAPVIEREAAAQGKALQDHYAHLVMHGTLHLLGFDHQTDTEAQEMESRETRLLHARGIDDPYQ